MVKKKKKIEKLILKKNLQNKIYLAGYENNFYFFMNNASAFILPSLWEELGLAIVQAAMSNTVIISSDCPRETIRFARWFIFSPKPMHLAFLCA